ncbi:permease [Clostridium tetanomorphum]|nr:permease [Clostridium tetanomorphum]
MEQDQKSLVLFKGSAVIIAIFAAIFVLYSSSFFIRKRKKELGLYSLLGLKKRQIGSLLFYENIIIGSIALLAGLLMGGLLSKLFIMILIKFIGMNLLIKFSIGIDAVLHTIITFGILFLIVSINAYTIIYRFKLIDLFKANSTSENKSKKSTKPSIVLALLSIIFFVIEGIAAMTIKDSPTFLRNVPIALVTSIIGTFIFFGTFLTFMISVLKRNKKLYYKGDNLISISHFLYRIKSNAKTLSIIAITNAVALTSISVTYSIDYNMKKIYKTTYPFSYSYITTGKSLDKQVEDIIKKHPENKLITSAESELVKVSSKLENFPDLESNYTYLISISKYKHTLKLKGLDTNFKIPSSSQAILLKYGSKDLDEIKGKTVNIHYKDLKNSFKIIDRKLEEPLNVTDMGPILLVQDEIYEKYYNKDNVVTLKAYSVQNPLDSTSLTKDIIKIMPDDTKLSYVQDMKQILILTSMMLFIGILVGLVFLTSTGSILYFKQLTEANDDKERYTILRKIGISKKETKKSIKKQLIIIFILPIIIGLLHNLLALALLTTTIDLSIKVPIIISIVSYVLIYSIYYLLTVKTYAKIVTEN